MPVVNMLNTKYIIQADQTGKESVYPNPGALGAAWFVSAVRYENTPQAVMNALTNFHPKDTAVLFSKDRSAVGATSALAPSDTIQLDANNNDEITYHSNSAAPHFAVFSEVFYEKGWKAYIDDREVPIIRANYVLRGLSVPSGQHNIKFVFHPSSFYTGKTISLLAGLIVILLIIAAAVQSWRTKDRAVATGTPKKHKG